jgi:hypothetical protein
MVPAKIGFLVKLDFRDVFHIEDSEDCKFDYLEVSSQRFDLMNKMANEELLDSWWFVRLLEFDSKVLWQQFPGWNHIDRPGIVAEVSFWRKHRVSGIQSCVFVCPASQSTWEDNFVERLKRLKAISHPKPENYYDEMCLFDFSGSNGTVNYTHEVSEEIRNTIKELELSLDCIFRITVDDNWLVCSSNLTWFHFNHFQFFRFPSNLISSFSTSRTIARRT